MNRATRLVALTSASTTLGTVTELREVTKLVHEVGGLVVVDHSAAAPYRLIDIDEVEADVVALNALAWGGPPVGALVFETRRSSTRSGPCLWTRRPPGRRVSSWERTSSATSRASWPASNTLLVLRIRPRAAAASGWPCR